MAYLSRIDFLHDDGPKITSGNFAIGSSTPWPIPHFQQDDTPDTWHCAYCDRANPGDRLTCVGCQAGRQVRVARVRVTTYKGVPLSELSEAEREEAAEYARPRLIFQVPVVGIECGSTTTAQHTIIQRMKTFVGIR